MASAQALRDEEDLESWAVARARRKDPKKAATTSTASQAGAVAAFVLIGGAMVAVLMMGGAPRSTAGAAFPTISAETGKKAGMLDRASNALSDLVRSAAPVTLERKFPTGNLFNSSGVSDWSNVQLRASTIDDPRDWIGKTKSSSASLRLWKKSTAMQNYQMEFQGQL